MVTQNNIDESHRYLLSERSQTQKETYCLTPFIRNVQKGQIHGHRKQTVVARVWREEGWGVTASGYGVSFGVMNMLWN